MMERAAASFELYREINAEEGLGTSMDTAPEAWFGEEPVWGRGGALTDYFGNKIGRQEVESFIESYYDERAREPD
jgi:hypothetical protein